MFSIAGLHETAQVLKREASLPDPKPEVTPMSTPTNRKTRFNHTGTVTPIMSTPETPSLSRFRFGDPGTPTGKVIEAFNENNTRDRIVWRIFTPDSTHCLWLCYLVIGLWYDWLKYQFVSLRHEMKKKDCFIMRSVHLQELEILVRFAFLSDLVMFTILYSAFFQKLLELRARRHRPLWTWL